VRRRDYVPRIAERLVTCALKYPFRCGVEREVPPLWLVVRDVT
jgi:hypothetical protein